MTGIGLLGFGDDFCNFPTGTFRFTVGAFPPGDYVLEFYRRDIDDATNVLLVASVPFTVSGSPRAVPGLSGTSAALLILGLLVIARRPLARMLVGVSTR